MTRRVDASCAVAMPERLKEAPRGIRHEERLTRQVLFLFADRSLESGERAEIAHFEMSFDDEASLENRDYRRDYRRI